MNVDCSAKFLDRDASVAQDAIFTINERDCALAGAGVAVAIIERNAPGFAAERGNINCPFVLSPLHYGKLATLPIYSQFRGRIHKTSINVAAENY